MQLIPETASRFNVKDSFDPVENIKGGLAYLRWLLAYYRGNVALAVAGYNAGEGAVDRYKGVPPYKETQNYVRRILSSSRTEHPFDAGVAAASSCAAGAQVSEPLPDGPARPAHAGATAVGCLPVWPGRGFRPCRRVKQSVGGRHLPLPSGNPRFRFLGTGFVVGDGNQVVTNAMWWRRFCRGSDEARHRPCRAAGAVVAQPVRRRPPTRITIWPCWVRRARRCRRCRWVIRTPCVRAGRGDHRFSAGGSIGIVPVTHKGIVSAITPVGQPVASAGQLDGKTVRRLRSRRLPGAAARHRLLSGNSGSPLYDPKPARCWASSTWSS